MPTKKLFTAVAAELSSLSKAIAQEGPTDAGAAKQEAITAVAERMADVFQRENSRFDRPRFLKACGIPD